MKNLMRNESDLNIAEQLEQLRAKLAAIEAENAELKKNPPPANAPDFSKPVRVIKTGNDAGKILVKYKTQIEINVLEAVMLAVRMKDIMAIAKKCRTGKWVREISVRKPKDGEPKRNSYDALFIICEDGEKVSAGNVLLAKRADKSLDTDRESPANKANLKDRMDRFNDLWRELEQRAASR